MRNAFVDRHVFRFMCGLFFQLYATVAVANAVSLDFIFSEKGLKGGVPCGAIGDAYMNEPVFVYSQARDQSKLLQKRKLTHACAHAGGDCECYALYLDEVKATGQDSFFKVLDHEKKEIWIKAQATTKRSLLSLATESENAGITFKNQQPELFKDSDLREKISMDEMKKISDDLLLKLKAEIPQVIGFLDVSIPAENLKQKGAVDFWHPTASATDKPVSFTIEELRSFAAPGKSQSGRFERWRLNVLKQENNRFLAAGTGTSGNNRISSYSSTGLSDIVFFWIRPNTLQFKFIPATVKESSDISAFAPLIEATVYTARGTVEIKGQSYTIIEAELLVANPLKSGHPNAPEIFETKRYPLRKIWIRTYDDLGRIQFWLIRPNC